VTLANQLTLFRAFLGILNFVFLWADQASYFPFAFVLYIIAITTDSIDGYIARRTNTVSLFGAIADPVADKILVIGALIGFLRLHELLIPHWAVFLIIVRELTIGGLRTLGAIQGKVMSAEQWGKWKMGVQSGTVLAILLFLMLRDTWHVLIPQWAVSIPRDLVLLNLLVTWISALLYLRQNQGWLKKSWNAQETR
jgi:CDP-diacylglycerol--glycerol-3-phosphate 3-phosphatidyltransferase